MHVFRALGACTCLHVDFVTFEPQTTKKTDLSPFPRCVRSKACACLMFDCWCELLFVYTRAPHLLACARGVPRLCDLRTRVVLVLPAISSLTLSLAPTVHLFSPNPTLELDRRRSLSRAALFGLCLAFLLGPVSAQGWKLFADPLCSLASQPETCSRRSYPGYRGLKILSSHLAPLPLLRAATHSSPFPSLSLVFLFS
jgi:hypothetical protein